MCTPPLTYYGSPRYGSRFFLQRAVRLIGNAWFSGLSEIALLGEESSQELDAAGGFDYCNEKDLKISGFYFFETDCKLPWIGIYVREVYNGVPFPLSLTPVITLLLGRTLAHEAAHHRLRQKQKIYSDPRKEEALANAFAKHFETKLCSNLWFRFWRWILHDISRWHFAFGCASYRSADFQKAEKSFYKAWLLDPRNSDAAVWFWQIHEYLQRSGEESQDPGPKRN